MAPFARVAAAAVGKPALDNKTTANPGAKDDAEHDIMALPRPEPCFGQRKAICIIGDGDGEIERFGQIGIEDAAIDAGHVGADHLSGLDIDDAADGNRDGIGALGRGGKDAAQRFDEHGEIISRRFDAPHLGDGAGIMCISRLDGAAADVECKDHGLSLAVDGVRARGDFVKSGELPILAGGRGAKQRQHSPSLSRT